MKPTPSDQVSEERSAYKAGDRVQVQWSQYTQRIVSLHPHAAYAVFESDGTGARREAPLFGITSLVVNAYPGEPGKEPAPALSPKARRLKQLEGEIATGILELLIVGQQPPTVETLREVTAQAKVVVRANAMLALTKLLPEGLFA